jgi:phosphatidylinositol alpha-1,6-mannosyltransferase
MPSVDEPGVSTATAVTSVEAPRTLVVTNDFPPRVGGVQQYVWNLVSRLPAGHVSVLAPNWEGWREHDATQPYPVHRWPASFLWPTADLARRVRSLVREHDADVVLFGHGFPLPLLAPDLRAHGLPSVVLTHGAEVWMAAAPGVSEAFRWACSAAREVTAITRYTTRLIRPAIPRSVPLSLLPPAVDAERFSPSIDGSSVRAQHGLEGERVVLCVSRLVPRKGQDVLIAGLSDLRRSVPDAVLMLVGDGPDRPRLERLAATAPKGSVVFAGEVADADLPAYYAACDTFAMPCRSRWGGLEVEGFGIVFLEASATAKPVIAGRSGGSDEAVEDEVTGLLVESREPKAVALSTRTVLDDPGLASRLGQAGRERVRRAFTWDSRAQELGRVLARAAT